MAIVNRFWTVVKSNLNHLIGKAEDPEKMLNQMLLDMQEQLITAKKQVAIAIADEKRLLMQYEEEHSKAKEWEEKAMLAVNAGKDDLARQALDRKADHEKMAKGYQDQWQGQKSSVEKLKSSLNILSNKITEAKRNKNLLIARAKRAEAQKTITETMSGLSTDSAIETLDRMEQKINQMEAEAHATTELANEIEHDELSAQFKELSVTNTDSALKELKAKMGKTDTKEKSSDASSTSDALKLKELEKELEAQVSSKN